MKERLEKQKISVSIINGYHNGASIQNIFCTLFEILIIFFSNINIYHEKRKGALSA